MLRFSVACFAGSLLDPRDHSVRMLLPSALGTLISAFGRGDGEQT
jgi:hypothetical protein